MPPIKVKKNKNTSRKVERMNEILKSDTIIGNIESNMKSKL